MKYFSNLLLFSALLLVSVCHGEIVELTDATFEHETQVGIKASHTFDTINKNHNS
jgi:hypothetical protein